MLISAFVLYNKLDISVVLQLGVPVMPKSDNRYPENWAELSNNIKELANWKCQKCGKVCIKSGDKMPDNWTKSQPDRT